MRFSAEWWAFWAGVSAVALTAAAALAGLISWYFNTQVTNARDRKDAEFRLKSETDMTALSATAADSNRKAAEALSNLAEANARAAEARQKAAEANTLAESFRLDIAQANERAAEATRAAEKERIARLELEKAVAPRHVTPEQVAILKSILSTQSPPKTPIKVVVFIGTEDGIPFSLELIQALTSVGWAAEHGGQTTVGGHLRGVLILVKDPKTAPAFAGALQAALQKAGIGGEGATDPDQAEGQVTILIAPKR